MSLGGFRGYIGVALNPRPETLVFRIVDVFFWYNLRKNMNSFAQEYPNEEPETCEGSIREVYDAGRHGLKSKDLGL